MIRIDEGLIPIAVEYVSKDMFDFDPALTGMLFFKRDRFGIETKFKYLPKNCSMKKQLLGNLVK